MYLWNLWVHCNQESHHLPLFLNIGISGIFWRNLFLKKYWFIISCIISSQPIPQAEVFYIDGTKNTIASFWSLKEYKVFYTKFHSAQQNELYALIQVICLHPHPINGSHGKASACNAGDSGSIPGSGRSPGEGNGNPLQHSCLENPMDGGAWQATVRGVAKSRKRLSD